MKNMYLIICLQKYFLLGDVTNFFDFFFLIEQQYINY
jgi:hypothetical protein